MKTFREVPTLLRLLALFFLPLLSTAEDYVDPTTGESWYPRTVTGEKGSAVIYAPQVDGWESFEALKGWVAFRVTSQGSETTYFGSLEFQAATDTDVAAREVLLHDFELLKLEIDGLEEDAGEYEVIRDAFTAMSRKVPLDLVLAYLPHSLPLESSQGLNVEPPQIFVSQTPAMLLFVDGDPRFLPIEETDLTFVLNTPWDLLREGESGPLYLCYEDAWLEARALDADWKWARTLPAEFADLPDTPNWDRIRDCLPEKLDEPDSPGGKPPAVFYSNTAAELLLLEGPPEWAAIGDGGLEFASNSEQELFRVVDEHFLLLSGRWFAAENLDGPWAYRSALPEAFQDIPPEDSEKPHEKSYVRLSIPGTEEAWEAALVASIPRKAEIQRGTENALDIDVNYAGEPVFSPIEDTGIELAVNTSYQVLRYEGGYYLCHNATWLTGSSATGPWQFADSIPNQFALIPPSSPAYNTTFVKVEGSDVESIQYEYTSGYEGAYVSDDTVVQGTGYGAPAVTMVIAYTYASGYPYPYYPYYWWPPTYGYGSWYNPATGRYGEAVVGYGPYGAAGGAAFYNPETGVYGRGQGVWDNDEFAGRGFAYNPNTDTSISRNRYIDFEDNEGWSENIARRGDEWRYSQSDWEDGRMVTEFESSRGTEGTVVRERQGDTIVSEGTITRENRSATFEGTFDDGTYAGNITGSEGGTGEMNRQLEDGQITGGSTFTKDGTTIETDVTRTGEGVQREFETSGGGQGISQRSGDSNQFVYQSGSGDMYAGRDGNVYQKTDDGWSRVENPGAGLSSQDSRQSADRSRGSFNTGGSPSRAAAGRSGAYSGVQGGYDLNRDFRSRQQGYDRYQRYQATGGRSVRGGDTYQRRRRR